MQRLRVRCLRQALQSICQFRGATHPVHSRKLTSTPVRKGCAPAEEGKHACMQEQGSLICRLGFVELSPAHCCLARRPSDRSSKPAGTRLLQRACTMTAPGRPLILRASKDSGLTSTCPRARLPWPLGASPMLACIQRLWPDLLSLSASSSPWCLFTSYLGRVFDSPEIDPMAVTNKFSSRCSP